MLETRTPNQGTGSIRHNVIGWLGAAELPTVITICAGVAFRTRRGETSRTSAGCSHFKAKYTFTSCQSEGAAKTDACASTAALETDLAEDQWFNFVTARRLRGHRPRLCTAGRSAVAAFKFTNFGFSEALLR